VGVPSSQALPGYLITAPPSVCVPDVIGALAVWIPNPKKKKHWDKCRLRTALEWVVFTSSRTARLPLTKVLDAEKNWK